MFADAYRGKTVFVTGHTGFKGSWLCLWLERLGARVVGYSLAPPTQPSLFEQAGVASGLEHHLGDVRDAEKLTAALTAASPDFVFHLAAQPLVIDSYAAPAETFAINVTGSINLMEAVRASGMRSAVVMVTTDKVYRNLETGEAFREDDPLGGHDPYSASKAAMEVAVASWRSSFFASAAGSTQGVRIATARAGNVIGGGDWSANRLVPDLMRRLASGEPAQLRNPSSLRPWQHVLEPLAGYLWLGAKLAEAEGERFAEGWNFGPEPEDARCVGELADAMLAALGQSGWIDASDPGKPHEAGLLRLSIDKAEIGLGWRPVWGFAETAQRTARWYDGVATHSRDARQMCLDDLLDYCQAASAALVDWAHQ